MRISCLIENTSYNGDFLCEHGLSLYIQAGGHNILFDMGQGDSFIKNAKKLGIDLSQVDIAILSHGHYDHGGGLEAFLEINSISPVYLGRYAFEPHYNGCKKYIGLDTSLVNNNRLIFVDDILKIDTGLTLFSCNDKKREFNLGSFGLTILENDSYLPDDFRHEQYLLIEEDNKKVLISGCSHKGILNIASWFEADYIIGGFHFSKLPLDNTLLSYSEYLQNLNTVFYTCHCTGINQYEFMKNNMKELHYISSGQVIEI
ncbi:MAG: MBL fold metallo-hydrolase [Clostridia bacterium]|nr:MBL fold metallo-hydrolase [Clostridia bacterium]